MAGSPLSARQVLQATRGRNLTTEMHSTVPWVCTRRAIAIFIGRPHLRWLCSALKWTQASNAARSGRLAVRAA